MLLKTRGMMQKIFAVFGYKIVPLSAREEDLEDEFKEIYQICKPYTMTSLERMYALYQAVKYIINFNIPGDFVECGVWRGGRSMLVALTLLKHDEVSRKIYLYDTFEGMSKPTRRDKLVSTGKPAFDRWKESDWCIVRLDETRTNMLSSGYPERNIIFVKGKVEDMIPGTMPQRISVLRLDTDWYESTYHELQHLYPLISNKGILIIDDYGFWTGAKEATDRYFQENKIPIFLNRIDRSGRLGIKCNDAGIITGA